jgi:hypothetical protein
LGTKKPTRPDPQPLVTRAGGTLATAGVWACAIVAPQAIIRAAAQVLQRFMHQLHAVSLTILAS